VLLQDKEIANGGTAPRMLCLDDYFVVEIEKVVTDPETGKKVKKMVTVCVFSPLLYLKPFASCCVRGMGSTDIFLLGLIL